MYIPGRNPVVEALRSNVKIHKIYLEQGIRLDEKIEEIQRVSNKKSITIIHVSGKQLDKMSTREPHQGVIADVDIELTRLNSDTVVNNNGLYIYIREAQYEHNIGAIIRTAEAAGAKGVIIPPKIDLTPVIARISMGAIFHIPIYSASLFPAIKEFKSANYRIWAIEINGATSIYETEIAGEGLLIVGGEDKSISEPIAAQCDNLVYIPQLGKVNSLNMSVAAGIAMYEHLRQTNYKN